MFNLFKKSKKEININHFHLDKRVINFLFQIYHNKDFEILERYYPSSMFNDESLDDIINAFNTLKKYNYNIKLTKQYNPLKANDVFRCRLGDKKFDIIQLNAEVVIGISDKSLKDSFHSGEYTGKILLSDKKALYSSLLRYIKNEWEKEFFGSEDVDPIYFQYKNDQPLYIKIGNNYYNSI